MSASIKNILLVLTFVIILPISIFTIMEISTLNENEEVLEKVYREQLDGIIFSINQYSGDIFSFYLNQIEIEWVKSNQQSLVDSSFIQQNLSIAAIGLLSQEGIFLSNLNDGLSLKTSKVDSIFNANTPLIERLKRYKETSYIKPEPLGQINIDGQTLSVIMVVIGEDAPCVVLLDPVLFIENLLAPKMQEIATQDLDIAVRYTPTGTDVYSNHEVETGIIQGRELWLLPNYELRVSLRGESIEELIAYRTKRNLISLVLLLLMIVVGFILVLRNLRREMQLSKAKADFVANVSHEIRTPLALISMFNETLLLDRVPSEEKKKEYYEIISKETSRLKNIINKILSFSQIDAEKKIYNFVSIDPNREIEEVINSYSYHLKNKGFEYHLDLTAQSSQIQADKEAFVEVIINLIDNAIKYSTDTKYVLVRSFIDGSNFIIEVVDKGVGIDRANQQHVFEKFYRVNGGNIHNTKGTGLGLSLVAGIMHAHSGKIELESKPGEGSTFRLYFPNYEN